MTPDCADSRYGLPVSGQRATSAAATSDRSIYPKISGVPWWAAIVIAVTATGIGFAFDAGSGTKELTMVFAASYVAGCVAAVLTVRQSGVFTAVIQPPLLLFCAVPGAYWLFHGAKISGVKEILINCGYPLIERFPLMVCTSAGVLVIGVIRWYLGTLDRGRPTASTEAEADADGSRSGGLGTKLAALLGRGNTEEADEPAAKTTRRVREVREAPRRSRSTGSTRSGSGARSTTRRSTPTRSRPTRSTRDDTAEVTADRARRRRPVRDVDTDAEPRRRSRPVRDPDLRRQPPREVRRDPHTRYGRPAARSTRFDPYEPLEPYDPPPRRRPASDAAVSRASSTHHPISQVRYRGAATAREAQSSTAESWEYDI
jgi:hypothetical protein